MPDYRETLRRIRTFPSLIKFLQEELDWPIISGDFEELTFDYTPEELGIDTANAAKIQEIKRLRPLEVNQPWGIFFVMFEPKRLPVVALRRILSRVVLKKRASANRAESAAWQADDLLFVSNYGEGDERQISFAHFAQHGQKNDLPTLKVLGWDNLDTPLHLDHVADMLVGKLFWPDDPDDLEKWRKTWRSAFTLRHGEVINTSKDLAVRLAELARAIRDRIKTVLAIETANGPLTRLMKAFQEALVHDLDADGFADMYAQTIAYGLLSARVENPQGKTADDLGAQMTNPFLKDLMETFLHVGGRKGKASNGNGIDFDELGVSEVVELLDTANMEAVVRDFGDLKPEEDPVIHFYELFLKEYDAKKKMQRGVFYTPRPVVSYIVRSVNDLLHSEFGLTDGLADTATWGEMIKRHQGLKIPQGTKQEEPFVQILDPATGTGTFLVEVIDVIHKTMTGKWQSQGHSAREISRLWNDYVPRHLLPRLYGYELLMAPYAIAHMKIGLKLYETGYRFGSNERVRVFLTNALEPAHDFSGRFAVMIPALAHEAQAVNAIKRGQRFTVVIGNPPYSVKSFNKNPWIRGLLEDFKRGLNETKLNLDDDFIKFIRYGIYNCDASGAGVVSMITNNIYLSAVTHRNIRRHLLNTFRIIDITNLHGDTRYGEVKPQGLQDKNVFDIQQGVCVSAFIKHFSIAPRVRYTDIWGLESEKSAQLRVLGDLNFLTIEPTPPLWLFQPTCKINNIEYDSWPLLTELMPLYSNGIETHKDGLTIHFTQTELRSTIENLLTLSPEKVRFILGVGEDGRDWKLAKAIGCLRAMKETKSEETLIVYRPFDFRYTVLNHDSGGFIAYPRWEVMANFVRIPKNVGLVSARLQVRGGPWDSCLAVRFPTEKKTGDSTRSSTIFPLFVNLSHDLISGGTRHINLAEVMIKACKQISNGKDIGAEDIFNYIYALLHSASYRSRYAEALKIDFPRLPLPSNLELFRSLARLGGEFVALHLVEAPVQQALSARYDQVAKAWRYDVTLGHRRPVALTFTGPAAPVVDRVGWSDNTVWLNAAATKKGQPATPGTIGFQGVSEDVWNFHIGGYQVCQKWLKDRKGRTLSADDLTHYHRIVVALHETIRLMAEIDEVIDQHGSWPGAFTGDAQHRS